MFSPKVFISLLAISASALAAPGLSLKVAGAEAAEGVENLKVTATLTNTGDSTLKLLNDPRTALSKIPTDSFSISSKAGKAPSFSGIKVKYIPSEVAKKNSASSFTVLAPGASIDIEHDLASSYNFTASGEDTYEIEASNLFRYVDESNEVKEIYADATAHAAKLTGTLAVSRSDPGFAKRDSTGLERRIGYNSCTSSEQSTLVTAAANANTYAANAKSYLSGISSGTSRYTTWFGTYSASRKSTVTSHYTAIAGTNFNTYTYDCTCSDSDVYAYVYPDSFGTIYLCGVFWQTGSTGTDSRAGTLIHESSHFTRIAGTDDIVYGQTGAKNLAKSNPSQAIMNADSHEYFAENTPALS